MAGHRKGQPRSQGLFYGFEAGRERGPGNEVEKGRERAKLRSAEVLGGEEGTQSSSRASRARLSPFPPPRTPATQAIKG